MPTYISLLRGINVSGQKKVPMAELRSVYASLGLTEVQSYIQSGNVIFQSKETDPVVLRNRLQETIYQHFGFEVVVLLRTVEDLQRVLKHSWIQAQATDKQQVYVTFLAESPDDPKRMEELISPPSGDDKFQLEGKEVFVFCPNGYGRTKLNNTFFERKLKVSATTRHEKTIRKLLELTTRPS